jgi:hypothetical protein
MNYQEAVEELKRRTVARNVCEIKRNRMLLALAKMKETQTEFESADLSLILLGIYK